MAERTRRPGDARSAAEAAFKSATTKAVPLVSKPAVIPNARELVSIRVDRDVLAHFQDEGPGWQDRMNLALRRAAGL